MPEKERSVKAWHLDITHRGFRIEADVMGDHERIEQGARDAIDWWLDQKSTEHPDPLVIADAIMRRLSATVADSVVLGSIG